ncbi:MAG: Na/Pi cotransporter family protein [Flavobacteriales bacterium]
METLHDILSIIGALGLFIFGMKVMSENVQRAAGSAMRKVVSAITRSRLRSILTGLFTTSLLQSSSAVTVMAVSFVNAGILKLRDAVGVIMGANIGTTVTAWVIAFAVGRVDIRALALPMIAVALPLLFTRRSRLRYTAETIIGFAVMFIGLQLLQGSVPALNDVPQFVDAFTTTVGSGFTSPLVYVVVGTLFASIVQSSTAAIALTVALMANGVITLDVAAALVLGENIGTTVTANLAALVANREAQRAARVHTLINVFGALWMVFLIPFVIPMIEGFLSPFETLNNDAHDATVIAIFHTGFNIVNILILVLFTPQLIRVSEKLVRKNERQDTNRIEYIGGAVMATPELAVLEVQKEMRRFAKSVVGMNRDLRRLLDETDEEARAELIAGLRRTEEKTDRFKKAISTYLTELARLEVAEDTSIRLSGLMSAANNLERIGDLYYQIAMGLEEKHRQKVYFIPRQRQSLKEMTQLLDGAYEIMETNLNSDAEAIDATAARNKENEVNAMRDELRDRHLRDVVKDKYSQSSGVFYSDTFSALEEVADHIFGVSEGMSR